jgi:HPt (histidine-containing phosphotransfer) domain-containing protein
MHARRPPSQPAVNLDELLARVDNDRELLRDLIVIFKSEFPGQMSALRLATSERDVTTTEKMSHTLKGMLLSLAATRAASAAGELEQLGRRKDGAALAGAFALLEEEVAQLLPALEVHLVEVG